MKVVYKHTLDPERVTEVLLPLSSKVLTSGIQGPKIQAWVLHDTDQPLVKHRFYILMTGESMEKFLMQYGPEHEMPEDLQYLNTIWDHDTGLVYHVFYSKDH